MLAGGKFTRFSSIFNISLTSLADNNTQPPMKSIFLVRHAAAIDKRYGMLDRDRPLTPEGKKAAKRMACRLAKEGIAPELIISSPADRALETAHIFAAALKYPLHGILIHSSLYDHEDTACWQSLLPAIRKGINILMLVGHNPCLPTLAEFFAGPFALPLPKAGFVQIHFPDGNEWHDIPARSGKIVEHDYPDRKKRKLQEIQTRVQKEIMGGLADYIHLIGKEALPEVEKKAGKAGRKIARLLVKRAEARPDIFPQNPPEKQAD